MLPQRKRHSYRAERSDIKHTAVRTKAAFSPQFNQLRFNALHCFQRRYNAKERIRRQITVIRNTSCNKSKKPGPAIQKLQDNVWLLHGSNPILTTIKREAILSQDTLK